MKLGLLIFTLTFSVIVSHAQSYVFSYHTLITENGDILCDSLIVPIALTTDCTSTLVTYSNSEDSILFYSDGIYLYNRDGEHLENGRNILGSRLSSQSVTLIPESGFVNMYYQGKRENNQNIIYRTQIDLEPDMVITEKNLPFLIGNYSYVTNIANVFGESELLTYDSDSRELVILGISGGEIAFETRSYVGLNRKTNLVNPLQNSIAPGGISVSLDNSLAYISMGNIDSSALMSFDVCTRTTRVIEYLFKEDKSAGVVGSAFSPNNRFLYVIEPVLSINGNILYQYDFERNRYSTIENSNIRPPRTGSIYGLPNH